MARQHDRERLFALFLRLANLSDRLDRRGRSVALKTPSMIAPRSILPLSLRIITSGLFAVERIERHVLFGPQDHARFGQAQSHARAPAYWA
jgi:hypothetical protein